MQLIYIQGTSQGAEEGQISDFLMPRESHFPKLKCHGTPTQREAGLQFLSFSKALAWLHRSSCLAVWKPSTSRQHLRGRLRALAGRDVCVTNVATFIHSKKCLILHQYNHIKVLLC